MALAKMRTAQQVYDQIHKEDPESSVSLWYIRLLVKQGKIPVLKAGSKFLINYDRFLEYLNGEQQEVDTDPVKNEYGKLRRVGD